MKRDNSDVENMLHYVKINVLRCYINIYSFSTTETIIKFSQNKCMLKIKNEIKKSLEESFEIRFCVKY